jgi:ribonuclease VapC
MVIDSSALLAILLDEPGAEAVERAIEADPTRLLSAASLVEAGIVIETRLGEDGARELDLVLVTIGADVVPVDRDQAEEARIAYRAFGKGRHPAALNYGDCFTYALSVTSGEPVLTTSQEFARTDLDTVPLAPDERES